jgi:hypothetical protein
MMGRVNGVVPTPSSSSINGVERDTSTGFTLTAARGRLMEAL